MSTERPLELPAVLGAQIAFSDLELDPEHETGLNVYGRHRLMQGLSSVGKLEHELSQVNDPRSNG